MNKEDYFRKVIGNSMRIVAENLLKTNDFSKRYYTRIDRNNIDDEIRKMSEELTLVFIKNLKKEGFINEGKELSEGDFSRILNYSVKEYLGVKRENGN